MLVLHVELDRLIAEALQRVAFARLPGALDELHDANPTPAPDGTSTHYFYDEAGELEETQFADSSHILAEFDELTAERLLQLRRSTPDDFATAAMKTGDKAGCMKHMEEAHKAMGL